MWCLTVDSGSLLSVVKFNPKLAPDMAKKHGALDGDFLLVRARIKASLTYVGDVLEAIFKGEVPGWERPLVDEDKTADYKYRTIVTPDEWKKFLCFEVDGIDYSSHVKEETVRRQPEPKVKDLYTALSKTWSAWAALQDTRPYSGLSGTYYGGYSKPDCKNCDHREISHSIKGDKCNFGGKWNAGKMQGGTCTCTKYEAKPAPAKQVPPPPVPKNGAVGTSSKDPEYKPLKIDYSVEGDALEDADGSHQGWCPFYDGDPCMCSEPSDDDIWGEYPSLVYEMTDAAVEVDELDFIDIDGVAVPQEPEVPGESKQDRKRRMARNRRRRRTARRRANAF